MRDYSQYALTPTKNKHKSNRTPPTVASSSVGNNSNLLVTPSPASSSVASYPVTTTSSTNASHNHAAVYRQHPATITKSQVAVLNRSTQQHLNHHHHSSPSSAAPLLQQAQQQQHQLNQQQQQKRDAGSISTAATQSSNDHSPRSNNSDEQQQQQQQNSPQQHAQHQQQHYPNNSNPHPNRQHKSPQHHQQQQSSPHHNKNHSGSSYPSQYSLQHQQHQHQRRQQQSPPHLHHLHHLQQQHQYSQHHHHQHHSTTTTTASSTVQSPSSTTTSNTHHTTTAATMAATTSPNTTNSIPARDLTCLTPADALSLKRDGPEATIVQLRQALEEARLRDAAEKSNLAKSDATILELRSSVRQLKRQLEKLDGEARQKHSDLQTAKQQLQALKQQQKQQQQHDDNSSSQQQSSSFAKEEYVGELQVQLDKAHAQILTADMVRKELEDTLEAEQYTWELRVQDQERTIVELQQEIGVLAEDLEQCRRQWKQADEEWAQKVAHLEQTLRQYQQQQQGNKNEGTSPKQGGSSSISPQELHQLRDKLRQLEEERNELQTCLDEALQELEAVDAELGNNNNNNNSAEVQQLRKENQRLQETVQKQRALQQQQQLQQGDADFDTLEGLQHLYRWLLERSHEGGEEKKHDTMPQTSPQLLDAIHHVLESMPSMNDRNNPHSNDVMAQKLAELEAQVVSYQGDLQARDEAGAELRTNLQEAVALIKPLQDAVDKADQQKADLQQEVERLRAEHDAETKEIQDELRTCEQSLRQKEQECDQLHHDIHRLQVELEDAKELAQARASLQGLSPTAAAAAAAAAKIRPPLEQPQELSSLSKARADLKAKRAQEQTLRSLLRDAQNRFHTLNQQNQNVEAMNQQLQGRLRDVEGHRGAPHDSGTDDAAMSAQVRDLEQQISNLKMTLEDKTREVEKLTEQTQRPSPEMTKRIQELEEKLSKSESELKHRLQSEKVLNKSLKEALGLLKPLKNHLEDAEAENKELSKEVRTLRRKVTSMEISGMGTVVASPSSANSPKSQQGADKSPLANNQSDEKMIREKEQLEETVRHLEQENSQLHDALDELSRMNNGQLSPGNANNGGNSIISSKAESRLNQEIVELKSRYEVTQSRLEDAYVENHTLVEALKEKEESEKDAIEGMRILREKLRKTEMDLQNAKYIATSALVKVEQAKSLENNNNISINSAFESESHTVLSLEEKAIELDLMGGGAVGVRPSPSSGSSHSPPNGLKSRQFQHAQQQQHPQHTLHHHHPQPQQVQHSYSAGGGGPGGPPNMHKTLDSNQTNGWAGKRSRLADF